MRSHVFSLALVIATIVLIALLATLVVNTPTYKIPPRAGFNYTNFDVPADPKDIVSTNPDGSSYVRKLPIFYTNWTPVYVTENRTASDPSFSRLASFLNDDPTEKYPYTNDTVCTDFAVRLYDQAELHGIKAHMVLVYFTDGGDTHVIDAFYTTDRGLVYVDDTGRSMEQFREGQKIADRIVDLEPGQPYTSHFLPPLDSVPDTNNMGIVDHVDFLT